MKQKRESEALNLKKQDNEITSQEYSQLLAGTVKFIIILKIFKSFKKQSAHICEISHRKRSEAGTIKRAQ